MNAFDWNIQYSLDDRTFGSQHHNFVVLIPECRTDAPWVAYGKSFSASCHSADYVSTVPFGRGGFQYVGQVYPIFDGMCDVHAFQSFFLALVIQAFHFSVESVSHLFQHNICIGIFSRMLSCFRDVGKDFVYIGQIEIAAQSQVLGTPVVAAKEGVYIRDTAFSCRGIAKMSHVEFAGKGQAFFGEFCIMKLFFC